MNKVCATQGAKPIYATVRAKEKRGAVDFKVKWKTNRLWPFSSEGPIEQKVGSGPREIIFEIDDDTGFGLRFFDDPSDSIWVQPNSCPPAKCNKGGQIKILGVEDGGKVLRVLNQNNREAELHYALHMTGAQSEHGPPYCYDPIIKNRGG